MRSLPGLRYPTASLALLLTLAGLLIVACAGRKRHSAATDPTAPPAAARHETPAPEDRAAILFRGAKVMTATGVIYDRGDVLVRGQAIEAVGVSVTVPDGARIVDVSGKTLTPGLIDTHSHIGVYASPSLTAHSDGNEMVGPVTAHVWSAHGYWPQDPQIDRARAGGVTTMQILPGSANLIGGRSVTVKTYRHSRSAEDARFKAAPFGLKMACGENPKRVYGEKGGPHTRMGNIAGMRAAFEQARGYQRKWDRYAEKKRKFETKRRRGEHEDDKNDKNDKNDKDDDPPEEPDRDFGLETLAAVLRGEILVHNHCYRADEMSIIMGLAEEYGFRVRSFHHAVEAYKIADRLAAHGAAASVWADWWGFKAEAYDGIRENAAMVSTAGARAVIHSDSAVGVQRLNQEAAKAMHAGRRAGIEVSENEALRWITANPAWALGVHDHVGTLEAGKQADLVIWDGDPFSVYSRAERVYIEGDLVYDRGVAAEPGSDFEVGLPVDPASEVRP